ncbi:GlxA family transcriptional regulator [Corynebacterium sp. H113]|uniref:GlxA family transcriptional regulator n=1 Tax=Corynebacterium sp. H113 TaxID=3133419 RepID=UPI0030A3A6A5
MKRIGFLVFDGVTMLDLHGPAEVFGRARGYEMRVFSPHGGTVFAANGLPIADTEAASAAGATALDTVVITGSDTLPDEELDEDLLKATLQITKGVRRVASVCTGAFLLAELGLLDGRRTTTHWRNARDLAQRFPKVRVEPDMLHVHDGGFLSSAGITAGIDLALSLVEEDFGAEISRAIAQEMVVFMHRPGGQTQFAGSPNSPAVDSPILKSVLDRIFANPTGTFTVAELANDVAVSPRHLSRLFQAELGTTPIRWIEGFRLATAQRLILEGHTITAAARHSGFRTDENLRRAFDRRLHITPSEYRERFSSTFGRG